MVLLAWLFLCLSRTRIASDCARPMAAVRQLREDLRETYPEIDELCSDAYLQSVLDVPGRSFEKARDAKIAASLAWRREFGVDALCSRLACTADGRWT